MKRFYIANLAILVTLLFGLSQCANAQVTTTTFSYTGSVQTYTVPLFGVTSINVDMAGASGGVPYYSSYGTSGNGGRVTCVLAVTPGQVLSIYVGQKGGNGNSSCCGTVAGGYNGGGAGEGYGAGAGGASDIRTGAAGLSQRIVVAGGGGGCGWGYGTCSGGAGGGLTAGNGSCGCSYYEGSGATQTAGGNGNDGNSGTFGNGGNGAFDYCGGGGGGWYGGGGGYIEGGGGGGSSYTSPTLATSVVHTQGYQSGNGYVAITPNCVTPIAGTITGPTSACVGGAPITLTDPTSSGGGLWSSSNTSVATVGSLSGTVTGLTTGTAIITYTVNNGPCGSVTPTYTINVNPVPAPITGNTNICSAFTSTLSSTTIGGTWSSSNTTVATVGSTGVVTGLSQGIATITYTVGGCGVTATASVNVSPNIYTVTGGGAYCSGSTVPHVVLSNSDVFVNYQLMLAGSATGGLVAGTGRALDFGAQPTSGTYTVMAINTNGGCTQNMSGSVTVTVNTPPSGANNVIAPFGNSFCAGSTGVVIGLNGSTAGISYQLMRGTAAYGTAVTSTGGAFNFTGSPANTAGTYTVMAYNLATGCTATMTGSQVVTSNPVPTTEAVSGGGSYCMGGSGVSISISPSDPGTTYQAIMGGTSYGTVTGTGGTVTINGVTNAGFYTVQATSGAGCQSTMSGIASVAIIPLPAIDTVTAGNGGGYCAGATGQHVYLSYSVAGISYQLYNGGGTVGIPITGIDAPLDFGSQLAGTYHVVATNSISGCTSTMAGAPAIFVNPLPAAYATGTIGSGAYCAGGAGVGVRLNNSTPGIVYQLYNNGVYAGVTDTATGGAINFGLQTASGYYTVMATNPVTGCVNTMADTATVVTEPLPTPYVVTGGGGYCAGGTGQPIGLSGSDAGISYKLYYGGTAIGTLMGTGAAFNFPAQTGAGGYTVVATNTVTTCVGNMSGSVSIVVNPLPAIFSITGGGPYCLGTSGSPVGLGFSNTGIQYQLMVGGTNVGLPLTGIDSVLNFGAQTIPGVYSVSATNVTTGCTANMAGTETVSSNPSPIVYAVTGGGGYCNGASGRTVGLSASNAGINYQLYNGVSLVGSAVGGTGSALNFGTEAIPGVYTVVASNPTTGCTSDMSGSAAISINPLPNVYTVTGGGGYCAGGTGAPIGTDGSDIGTAYQLYYNGTALGSPFAGTGSGLSFGLQTLAGVYTLSAMNVATTCADSMSGSANITINPLPATNTVTGGGNYCAGGTGVAVGLNGSYIGVNYLLDTNGVYSGVTLAGTGASLNYGLETRQSVYSVTAVNTTTGCNANMIGSVAVNMNPLPTAYTVTGGGNYCADSAAPNVGLSSSDAGIHYMLYSGATLLGSYSVGTGSSISFGAAGTPGVYTITAMNPVTGCGSDMAGSATVSRIPLVVPSVTVASSSSATVCSGTSVTFTATPVNGGSAPTYTWMAGTATITTAGSSYTYDPANGDVVTATLTSSEACASGPASSAPVTMTVIPSVTPAVTTASIQDSVCQGSTEFFYAVPTNSGTTPTYIWSYNGAVVQTGPGLTYSVLPANGDRVSVEMVSSVPCAVGSNTVTGNTITMYVQEPMVPVVTISTPDTNVVTGASVTFTATATNTTVPMYQWYINGNPVPGATTHVFTANNFTDGNVVGCTVSNDDICGTHSGSAFKTVHVIPEGVKQVNLYGSDISITPNPSQGTFTIKGTLATANDLELTFEVTNMLGQVVYNNTVMATGGKINAQVQLNNSVANGMYLLNVRSDGENAIFHIVVEK